jgi:hypothetical protein
MRLSDFEARWAGVIGRTLLPAKLLGGLTDSVDLGEELRRRCTMAPWYSALVLRVSLWLTWFAPALRLRRPLTFGGLGQDARETLLERLLSSPSYIVRATSYFFKLLRHIGAYEHGRLGESARAHESEHVS